MKKLILIAGLAAGMLTGGCGEASRSPEKPVVAVSIPPLGYIVDAIAGQGVEILTLAEKGSDPETFEPALRQRMQLENSDVLFTVGSLPFEKKISDELRSGSSATRVTDVAAGIEKITGTHTWHHHANADEHEDVDPHVWSSLRCARAMSQKIGETLMELYPDSAQIYRQRTNEFINHLDSADRQLKDLLAVDGSGGAFLVWHPSLSYFARDYSLTQIAVGAENKENTPARIRRAMEEAGVNGVRVIFIQRGMDSRLVESFLTDSVKISVFDPMAENFIDELTNVANEIALH